MLHASAVHGVQLDIDQVNLARIALSRPGMIGEGRERNRRPTQEELDLLIDYFEANDRQKSPMASIVKFAIATAMRQSEICSIEWSDVDERKHTVLVKDRKDPRNKDSNDQRVPLVDLTGYDAWQLRQEQRTNRKSKGRIFPHNPRSVGTAFRRACQELEIEDLHFHDLRHEATSRLFEAGLQIEQVAPQGLEDVEVLHAPQRGYDREHCEAKSPCELMLDARPQPIWTLANQLQNLGEFPFPNTFQLYRLFDLERQTIIESGQPDVGGLRRAGASSGSDEMPKERAAP